MKVQVDNSGARQFELNVEAHEKPVDPAAADQVQTIGTAPRVGEPPQETAQESQDEKLDPWMENVKQFIRNIDVKSL